VSALGAICACAQITLAYSRYVSVLKWLSFALFAYVVTLFFVKIDWGELARGLFLPQVSFNSEFLTSIVAILGTTISPYPSSGNRHRKWKTRKPSRAGRR